MMNLKKKWIVGLIICSAFMAFLLPKFFKNRNLPEILHGVWENSAPDYMNRYFLLDANAIGFGTGDGKVEWFEIVGVNHRVEGDKTTYKIEYQKRGGELLEKSLYYYPAKGGMIRFKNQQNIAWFHTKS
jgi:hypothetical protein